LSDWEKKFYENIFENAPVGIFRSTLEGQFIRVNPAVAAMLKYDSPEELIHYISQSNIAEALYEDPARRKEILRDVIRDQKWKYFVERFRCKDGRVITCNFHLRAVPGKNNNLELDGFIEDISERIRDEKRLRESLAEKEVLLKEIHHRVKNNLQVISSLLFLQSRKISDPKMAQHFVESQNRVFSMALAHELLYRTEKLSEVQLPVYVRSLVDQIERALKSGEERVSCRVDIEEIQLDIEQLIPCGLLITELLSNALKHAFPDGRSGNVEVMLRRRDDQMCLKVRDDGIGMPENLDLERAETLGLQLIRALTVQLDGDLEHFRGDGTLIKVVFPIKLRKGKACL
jgi:PAS domain S-box-containing protein